MSSPFDPLENGTVTLIRCAGTPDAAGGPIANYFNTDGSVNQSNVLAADIPAQIEYHLPRFAGDELMEWNQSIIRSRRDIWLDGPFLTELGDAGNGGGVKFTSTSAGSGFGRITNVERDGELAGMPTSVLMVVEVIAA